MTIDDILNSFREALEKNNISPENREYIMELLGELIIAVEQHIDFSQHPDALQNLANALINNKEILSTIQQQSAEMDALKRIMYHLTKSLELPKVLDAVVNEGMRLVSNAQDAHIFFYQDGKLSFGAALFQDGKREVPFAEPRQDGLTYTVARQRQVIVVEDIQDHSLYRECPKGWTGSIIGVPLCMGERVVGVMTLARTRSGPFSHSEIRLLTLLADQAAIAIVNARLHQWVSGLANSDALTGLPNRRALDEKLDMEIKRASRTGLTFAVIMMDLDGFKDINDEHGHDFGDTVLRKIARTLASAVRSTDFLARYGGDELTLILPDTNRDAANVVARKIQDQIKNLAIELPEGKGLLSISGGMALFPKHATTAPNLLRAADTALYHAKRHLRGSFEMATHETGQLPDLGPKAP